eukprot:6112882-Pleurochrysis_carterae.AAC.1
MQSFGDCEHHREQTIQAVRSDSGLAGVLTHDGDVLRAVARVVRGLAGPRLVAKPRQKGLASLGCGGCAHCEGAALSRASSAPELRAGPRGGGLHFVEQSALLKELHAAELEQRHAEHDLELKVLHDSLRELLGRIVDAASVKAKKAAGGGGEGEGARENSALRGSGIMDE